MSLRSRLNQLLRSAQTSGALTREPPCPSCHSPTPAPITHIMIDAGEELPTCPVCRRTLHKNGGPCGQILVVSELHVPSGCGLESGHPDAPFGDDGEDKGANL
jgi:hypothetical protein